MQVTVVDFGFSKVLMPDELLFSVLPSLELCPSDGRNCPTAAGGSFSCETVDFHRASTLDCVLKRVPLMQVTVVDFGFSKVLMPDELLFSACGSPHYAAPEVPPSP